MSKPNLDMDLYTGESTGIAHLLGNVNTEAKALTLTAIPSGYIPVGNVAEILSDYGAYTDVDSHRFQPGVILDEIDDDIVDLQVEYNCATNGGRSKWVELQDTAETQMALSAAGWLLDITHTFKHPLRYGLGEKRMAPNGSLAIANRLGVLASALSLDHNHPSLFSIDNLIETASTDRLLRRQVVKRHINRLKRNGLFVVNEDGSMSLGQTLGGEDAGDYISALLDKISKIAARDEGALKEGRALALDILRDHELVAQLVKQSFDTSTHTGKGKNSKK